MATGKLHIDFKCGVDSEIDSLITRVQRLVSYDQVKYVPAVFCDVCNLRINEDEYRMTMRVDGKPTVHCLACLPLNKY